MKPVENEELIEADIIRVFFSSENETCKCMELMPTEEEKETLTFEDIYNLAKKNGLAEDDMYILMIAEKFISTAIINHGIHGMNAERRRDLHNEKKTMQAVWKAVYASRQGSNLLSSVPAGTDEGKSRKKKGGI